MHRNGGKEVRANQHIELQHYITSYHHHISCHVQWRGPAWFIDNYMTIYIYTYDYNSLHIYISLCICICHYLSTYSNHQQSFYPCLSSIRGARRPRATAWFHCHWFSKKTMGKSMKIMKIYENHWRSIRQTRYLVGRNDDVCDSWRSPFHEYCMWMHVVDT